MTNGIKINLIGVPRAYGTRKNEKKNK